MANEFYSDAALLLSVVGVAYAAISLLGSGAAIRAKTRARLLIAEEAESDPELKHLVDQAADNVIMSRAEIEAAREKIAATVEKLPEKKDRDRIRHGIDQSNSAGVAGYVNDLLRKP